MLHIGCLICKHRIQDTNADNFICKAFPVGIPRAVIIGETEHDSILPGQIGDFLFEPADPKFFAKFFPDVAVPVTTASS